MELKKVEEIINYVFNDKKLLERAFTHASYNHEFNYETLEFLGDSILGFIVSECIYDENKSEGELTKIKTAFVSDVALTPISEKLGLDKFIIKSEGDSNDEKAVPSVYEALVAAIYFDGGIGEATEFVKRTLDFEKIPQIVNYKGDLQEFLQDKKRKLPVPDYEKCTQNIGTPQAPKFRTEIEICGRIFTGEAGNKKDAEQNAAKEALKYLKQGSR